MPWSSGMAAGCSRPRGTVFSPFRQRRRGPERGDGDPGWLCRPAAGLRSAQFGRRDPRGRRPLRRRGERRLAAGGHGRAGYVYASAAVMRGRGGGPTCALFELGRRRGKNLPSRSRLPGGADTRRRLPRREHRRGDRCSDRRPVARRWPAGVLPSRSATCCPAGCRLRSRRREVVDIRPAVAVLPFDNLSGDPAQDWFSDGLTEDLITELARNPELLVIVRNSTFTSGPADRHP